MKRTHRAIAALLSLATATSLLAGCGGSTSSQAASGASGTSSTGSYTISLAVQAAESTGQYVLAASFKDYVETNSDGQITVNLYPNSQLGGDREVLEAIQNDEITMVGTSTSAQANFVQDLFVLDLPFAFHDVDAMRYTLADENFVDLISQAYDNAGYHFMGFTDTYFRVTTSNRAINSAADLKGLTIRTMENKFHLAMWEALGANPTPLAFNELYTALQQGTVEAEENPVELIVSQKFYEQQDYMILTNHLGHTMGWVISQNFYNSLPDDLRSVVDEGYAEALVDYYAYVDENEELNRQTVADSGTEIIELSSEALDEMASLTSGVYDMIEEEVSPEIYKAYTDSISAYKASSESTSQADSAA